MKHSKKNYLLLTAAAMALTAVGGINDESQRLAQPIASSFHSPAAERQLGFERMTQYEMTLTIADSLDKFLLKELVRYQNQTGRGLSELVFHLADNAKVIRNGEGEGYFSIRKVSVDGKDIPFRLRDSILEVTLPVELAVNESVTISLEIDGRVPHMPPTQDFAAASLQQLVELMGGGSGHEHNYGLYGLADEIMSLDHFYAVIPRFDNGRFDSEEPSGTGDPANYDTAHFNVAVDAPKGLVIAASGTAVEEIHHEGRTVTRFQGAALRDFTLLASRKFVPFSAMIGKTRVTAYVLEQDREKGPDLLKFASQSLARFTQLLGDYPYKDLRVVEAPVRGGAGGMEYSTLVTVSKQFVGGADLSQNPMLKQLVAQANISDLNMDFLKDSVEFIVAHEVAHQWWHGLVGNNERLHPFVDESLTNYSTILYFEKQYGQDAAKKQEEMQLEMTYKLYRLLGGKDAAADQSTAAFKDSMQYGALVYAKGALFYRELRRSMGDTAFFAALRDYVTEHRFGFATPGTLKASLMKGSENPERIAALYDRWAVGTHADQDIGKLGLDNLAEMVLGKQTFEGEDGPLLRGILKGMEGLMAQ